MAEAQRVSRRRGRLRLLSGRLAENGEVLLSAYRELSKAIREEALLTPAAEWLVDNFHLVEGQLREIRENLPSSYYRELPKIQDGHLAGYPQVYGITWAIGSPRQPLRSRRTPAVRVCLSGGPPSNGPRTMMYCRRPCTSTRKSRDSTRGRHDAESARRTVRRRTGSAGKTDARLIGPRAERRDGGDGGETRALRRARIAQARYRDQNLVFFVCFVILRVFVVAFVLGRLRRIVERC